MHRVCKILTDNIETILARDGISGLELDRRAGLSQGRIAAIKRGMVPGVDAALAIAQYAGVTLDWLLTDHDAPAAKVAEKEEGYGRELRLELHVRADAAPGDAVTGRVIGRGRAQNPGGSAQNQK